MPTKHAILSELSADDLRANVEYYELEVADRRVKAQLVDALVGCEEATIEEILRDWYRDDLKALCRAFGIDDSARRKADLIARLVAPHEEQEGVNVRAAGTQSKNETKKKRGKASAQPGGNGATTGYEAELWAMADKLRGNMEPSDYKHVALGLIFLKYISDAFEAKRTELLKEEFANAEDPEEYLAENVFWVPKEARWSHLQARATMS